MSYLDINDSRGQKARQMLIDGKDWDEIRKETGLREKNLKRIQKEITSHF